MSAELVATLYSGLVLGSLYALMSMGLALVWGGLRVLNLAQGAFYMFGAYTALVVGSINLPAGIGLLAAFLVMGVAGAGLYAGPIRVLADRPDRENAVILATFGIGVIMEHLARFIFGPRSQVVPGLVSGKLKVGGVAFSYNSMMMIVATIILLSALAATLKWTRFGMAIRALAQQPEGAQLAGISRHGMSALIFFISSGLAGVGGVLLASYYFVTPYVGQNYILIALIVTILGGLGSMSGTLYAAYLVGITQSLASLYLGVRWSLPVLFTLIILVLVVRPGGIAGRVETHRL
jgi:branched-chain amino acid transport system permease protein